MAEQQISLQTDNIQTVPGGGVRMITTQVLINGVLTTVQMQAIVACDADGRPISVDDTTEMLILRELREIRKLLAIHAEQPDPGDL